ncbi:YHYH protein [Curvibacter sp. CHRR-16]|uniref:YHYH protein n=1 Tax=Curvibacter sp. CHRR-16 TaxID=2835872 RepID=UPI001BDB4587|nr:YHYH protein [Curvibacter sp. CHRR-16]MBT0570814.1 YHYH protein [Curvibacter sp. CHRR-16]
MRRALWCGLVLYGLGMLSAWAHDLTALPLGDGRLSNAPRKGWIWACRIDPQAGGAQVVGPWIKVAQGIYDFTVKPIVPGAVSWPSSFSTMVQDGQRILDTNALPVHSTGIYPIPSDSQAFLYDRNPNRISSQRMRLSLPQWPQLAAQPSCAPGAVGVLLSGVVLFNALDAPGRDAVAHETQDACQGHPQESGVYHYHSVSTCLEDKRGGSGEGSSHSALVGYMLDGFGIYGRYGEDGQELSSQDLDECHGHTHSVVWDGKLVTLYHYHATWDFPYTAGCLRGSYQQSDVRTISGPPPSRRMGPGGPAGMGPGGMPPPRRGDVL